MSLAREARCLFCTFSKSARTAQTVKRAFSSAPKQLSRKSDAATDTQEVDLSRPRPIAEDKLKKHFSPQQQAAIKAADKILKPDQLKAAGGDTKPWSLGYYDDLSRIDPVIDKPVQAPWTNIDENLRLKNDEEITQELYDLMQRLPDDPAKAAEAWQKFDANMRLTVGREEAERNPRSATAPDLPKLGDATKKPKAKSREGDGREEQEPSPALLRLMQMTGYSSRQIAQLKVKTLIQHHVTNQTRLGKIRRMYCLSVAGNGNGLIGVGEGKSDESMEAVIQSQYRAIRNMQPILRYENRTIFGDVDAKVSATELELYARPPGFGLRCQQYIFEICRCAGITDIAARVTRSRNPMNTVKATLKALLSQKDPEDIARARGKKLVDVRKVYYANQV